MYSGEQRLKVNWNAKKIHTADSTALFTVNSHISWVSVAFSSPCPSRAITVIISATARGYEWKEWEW